MYRIGVIRALGASHYLTGADFGAEGRLHPHDYRVEWTLTGPELDALGFLVNLELVTATLEGLLAGLEGRTLNDLPGWKGLNPSVERLARHLADHLAGAKARWDPESRVTELEVKVWENPTAWASWTARP